MKKILFSAAALGLVLGAASTGLATNGMNIEGYGPTALGMGGAGIAYDNGTAASMNNPATIGLSEGHRLDLAIGFLGPDVTSSVGGMSANSAADAFFMPALGWTSKKDKLAYGFAVYGQGGMGTEYNASSWLSDPSMGANTALDGGLVNRSEVGVGRVIVPVTFQVVSGRTLLR